MANADSFDGTDQEDLLAAIITAAGAVETALDGGPADRVVMDSATFAYMSSYMTPNHPLIGNSWNAGAPGSNAYGPGVRAHLPNRLGVIVSNGMPLDSGSKHQVLVVPSSECFLWEDNVQMIRAEAPLAPALGILLVCYQYAAFCYERYNDALQLITGISIS